MVAAPNAWGTARGTLPGPSGAGPADLRGQEESSVIPGLSSVPQKERPRGTPQPLPPPPPFLPYCERPDVPRPAWAPMFLEHYAMNSSEALAAAHAGIHIETLRHRRKTDRPFEAECDAAYPYHKQLTEWESHSVGRVTRNPLPFFAKLKKLDPAGYVERLVTVNASVTPEPDGVADLLAKMFGATLPGTLPLMVKKFGT